MTLTLPLLLPVSHVPNQEIRPSQSFKQKKDILTLFHNYNQSYFHLPIYLTVINHKIFGNQSYIVSRLTA